MPNIEWQDHLATGVDVLDAEHKELVALLARICDAESRGDVRAVVQLLKNFHAQFNRHFNAEEALLARLGFDELDQRRSDHWTSNEIFHTNRLAADDVEMVRQCVEYARAWFLDHLIRQDGALKEFFSRKGVLPRPWRRISFPFDIVKLHWRIALLAALPLLALIGIGWGVYVELRHDVQSMALMGKLNQLNGEIGWVTHEFQRERGIATMYLSDRRLGREALNAQIRRSNEALEKFMATSSVLAAELPDGPAKTAIYGAWDSLDIITGARADLERGSYNAVETLDSYSIAVQDMIAVVPEVVRLAAPSDFTKLTFAHVFLIQAKERAGRERASGAAVLAGAAPDRSLKDVAVLVAEEDALGEGFVSLAPKDLGDAFKAANRVAAGPLSAMRSALKNNDISTLSAQDWFETSSRRIDALRAVEVMVSARLDQEVSSLHKAATRRMELLGGGLVALILISVAMVVGLSWTILPPLRRLASTISALADGERIVPVPGLSARDELGAIARMVQQLKIRLIHGDLLEARRLNANTERLRMVADNLPGIVFSVHQPNAGSPVVACVSRKFRDILGLSPTKFVDAPLRRLLTRVMGADDRLAFLHALYRTGFRPIDFEFPLVGRDGKDARWLRILASPSRVEGGWLWDGVALDVSNLKRAAEEQAHASEELRRIERVKAAARLTRGIRRNLDDVLRPIFDHAEDAIRALPSTAPVRKDLIAILKSAQGIQSLGQQLSDIGMAHEGLHDAIDVVEVIGRHVEDLRPLLPSTVTLETHLNGQGVKIKATEDDLSRLVNDFTHYVVGTLGGCGGIVAIGTDIVEDEFKVRLIKISIGDEVFGDDAPVPMAGMVRKRNFHKDELAIAFSIADAYGGWVDESVWQNRSMKFDIYLPANEVCFDNVIHLKGAK